MNYAQLKAMHPIKAYCETHGITQSEFARRVGLSAPFVSLVIRGVEKLGREAAEKIVDKTAGEITFDALFRWRPEAAA